MTSIFLFFHKLSNSKKTSPVRPIVSFTPKDETMQNAKNPKKIVRLTLIDALMCPKT